MKAPRRRARRRALPTSVVAFLHAAGILILVTAGCDNGSDNGVQPEGSKPMAEFAGAPTLGNAPLDVSFTDLSTSDPTSWLWNFGDGDTSNTQNPNHESSDTSLDVQSSVAVA